MLGSFSNQTDPFELSLQRDKKEGAVRVNPSFESVLNDVLRYFCRKCFLAISRFSDVGIFMEVTAFEFVCGVWRS